MRFYNKLKNNKENSVGCNLTYYGWKALLNKRKQVLIKIS